MKWKIHQTVYNNHTVPLALPPHTLHRAHYGSLDIQCHTCPVQRFNWNQVGAATRPSTSGHLTVHSSHCIQQWVQLSQHAHFQQKALTYQMSSPKWQHLPFHGVWLESQQQKVSASYATSPVHDRTLILADVDSDDRLICWIVDSIPLT